MVVFFESIRYLTKIRQLVYCKSMNIPDIDRSKIRALRLTRRLKVKEAAKEMGVSAAYLSALETGAGSIGYRALIRVCLYYGVQVTDLLETTESESTQETTKPTNVAA